VDNHENGGIPMGGTEHHAGLCDKAKIILGSVAEVAMWQKFAQSNAGPAVLLIRLLVGWVFISEGIQKFLFPAALGVGRFIKIGIPAPHFFAPFVGVVEIVFGSLIVLGLLTRLATIPLLINIGVAIATTKVPMLMHDGIWKMLHEARTDFSMVLGLLFLLIVGAGRWSVDAVISGEKSGVPATSTGG
jgi:putative oxidoreductase